MRKLLVLICTIPLVVVGQTTRLDSLNADPTIWSKLDSILIEGNLLANYEASAWLSTDLMNEDSLHKTLHDRVFGYITYGILDSMVTVYYNKGMDTVYFKGAGLIGRMDKMVATWPMRPMLPLEKELAKVRDAIVEHTKNEVYGIVATDNYTFNLVVVPGLENYSAHLICADSRYGYTPYGKDYYFNLDRNGNVLSWKSEHSQYLGVPVYYSNYRVEEHSHRHAGVNPFPSSSDICQFLTYRHLHQLDEFSVYSIRYHCYFIYNATTNSFRIELL